MATKTDLEQQINNFKNDKGALLDVLKNYNDKSSKIFREDKITLNENRDKIKSLEKEISSITKAKSQYKKDSSEDIEGKKRIEKINKQILSLINQNKEIKKLINKDWYSLSFVEKIITSDKLNTDRYEQKIRAMAENNPKIDKLFNRFDNANKFIENVMNIVRNLLTSLEVKADLLSVGRSLPNYNGRLKFVNMGIKQSHKELKKLEMNELLNSIDEVGNIFKKNVNGNADSLAELKLKPGEWLCFETPFGKVKVTFTSSDLRIDLESSAAPTYGEIISDLDSLFNGDENQNRNIIKNVIDPMISYLKQKIDTVKTPKSGSTIEEIKVPIKSEYSFQKSEIKNSAAVLCGILMFAESHKLRNPTNRKLEKASIKYVKYLAEKGIKNPYSQVFLKVFSNKTARFTPALDGESFGMDFNAAGGGGKKQTHMLLGFKMIDNEIAILVSELPKIFKYNTCAKIKSEFTKFCNSLKKEDFIDFILETSSLNKIGDFCKKVKSPRNKNEALEMLEEINQEILKSKAINIFNQNCQKIDKFIIFSNKLLPKLKSNTATLNEIQKYKFSAVVNESKESDGYIKLRNLPNDKENDIYDFGGGIKKTPKQFFSHQIKTNLKRLYKLKNRTLPTKLLSELN